jgi:dephospho-CoA kinase
VADPAGTGGCRALVVGLTGGIGSGKTAVSDRFAALGVPVIDTDVIAREVVAPGQPALEEIATAFGPACVGPDGNLDRAELRRQVFADDERRRRLEAILHPRIRAVALERVAGCRAPYLILVIPLLVESGMGDLVDRVLVVDVPESVQIRRVMQRDQVDEAHARAILTAQAGRERRLASADEVITNDGDLDALSMAVEKLHKRFMELAVHGTGPGFAS